MPEIDEAELARLQAADASAKQLQVERDQAAQARSAAEAAHKQEMEAARLYIQQMAQQQQPQQQVDTGDDDAIVSRRDLRAVAEATALEVDRRTNERLKVAFQNQRVSNREHARARLGSHFSKWESEIEGHMDKLAPNVAADPKAYDEVFAFVRSKHLDEVIEERLAADRASRPAPEPSDDESAESTTTHAEVPQSPSAAPVSRPAAPAPTATAGRPVSIRKPAAPAPLTQDQRYVARQMGMSDEEYRSHDVGPDEVPDIFGFRDKKTGAMRTRV